MTTVSSQELVKFAHLAGGRAIMPAAGFQPASPRAKLALIETIASISRQHGAEKLAALSRRMQDLAAGIAGQAARPALNPS
jgi:hypothetical protein